MEDETIFSPTYWMFIMALGGLLRAWDRINKKEDDHRRFSSRIMGHYLLVILLCVAWFGSERWSGFLYMLFMPFGAYKVFDLVGTWAIFAGAWCIDQWREWRAKKVE